MQIEVWEMLESEDWKAKGLVGEYSKKLVTWTHTVVRFKTTLKRSW